MNAAIRRWVHDSHRGMHLVSNTQVGCGIKMIFSWYYGAQSVPKKYPEHHYARIIDIRQDGSLFLC